MASSGKGSPQKSAGKSPGKEVKFKDVVEKKPVRAPSIHRKMFGKAPKVLIELDDLNRRKSSANPDLGGSRSSSFEESVDSSEFEREPEPLVEQVITPVKRVYKNAFNLDNKKYLARKETED